mgnify:CR=1 FL=1
MLFRSVFILNALMFLLIKLDSSWFGTKNITEEKLSGTIEGVEQYGMNLSDFSELFTDPSLACWH